VVRPPRTLIAPIALLLFLPAFAGDFYLSYHLVARDQAVVDEKLSVSPAMTPFAGAFETICRFHTDQTDFPTFAKTHPEPLLACLQQKGIRLRSFASYDNLIPHKNALSLQIPPTRLKVKFNGGLVIIKSAQ
jgi:hypothetical protein